MSRIVGIDLGTTNSLVAYVDEKTGLSYSLEFDSEIGTHDKEFEIDGIRVVVDKKSYLYLNGTTLDYVQQGLTGGFTFLNPSAKSSCGCGTSFSA